MTTKTLVVGLDCAAPHLVFERYADAMPNLSRLRARGVSGPLRSVSPPITVPAWACMTTGLDPGELGLYGFRLRERGSYDLRVATSRDLSAKRTWDRIGENGRSVAALFVPPNTPPKPVRGTSVGCFLTPDGAPYAFPSATERELEARFGAYLADVGGFRAHDRERIRVELGRVVDQHFAIAKWVLRQKRPSFAMMVEIAIDRLHHAFYQELDPAHESHDPASAFASIGEEIYGRVDAHLGELLAIVGDDCDVLVVSDHGAKPMLGGFCLNDFLVARGDLVLKEPVPKGTPFAPALVDWSRTRAFGEGGYYGRLFVNERGRDPAGIVVDREAYLAELERALETIELPSGGSIPCRIDRPERIYRKTLGFAPDLMIYPGDLDYRVLGSLGNEALVVPRNDRGPDACNHDWNGIIVASGPSIGATGELAGASLLDVNDTLLTLVGLPKSAHGRDLRDLRIVR